MATPPEDINSTFAMSPSATELCPEAFADLRRRYTELALLFGVPPLTDRPETMDRPGPVHESRTTTRLDSSFPACRPTLTPSSTLFRAMGPLWPGPRVGLPAVHWRCLLSAFSAEPSLLGGLPGLGVAAPGPPSPLSLPIWRGGGWRPSPRNWLPGFAASGGRARTADEARLWLRTLHLEYGAGGGAAPGVVGHRRPQVPERFRLGRAAFKPLARLHRLREPGGAWATDPVRVEELLWRSRQELWTSVPDTPAVAHSLLQRYIQGRKCRLAAQPVISQSRIAGAILAARGSAPGVDNVPYELYHYGLRFVTALLAAAFQAAADGSGHLGRALGPN